MSYLGLLVPLLLTPFAVAWWQGLLNQILPTPLQSAAIVRDGLIRIRRYLRGPEPRNRFVIVIATLHGDDASRTHTLAVERAFRRNASIKPLRRHQRIWLDDIGPEAEQRTTMRARKLLSRLRGDILIWGEVVKSEQLLQLSFVGNDLDTGFQNFKLETNLLGRDFDTATTTAIVSLAMSAIRPIAERSSETLAGLLQSLVSQLGKILEDKTNLSDIQQHQLSFGEAIVQIAIGEVTADRDALLKGIEGTRAAAGVAESQQDYPLLAELHFQLGKALRELGDEERPSDLLLSAGECFKNASALWLDLQNQISWAKSQNALGVVQSHLMARHRDEEMFRSALETFASAHSIRTQTEFPEQWAGTRNNIAIAQLKWGDIKSDTNEISEAIEILQDTADSLSPSINPRVWATTQSNLGAARLTLAKLDRNSAYIDEAISYFNQALWLWKKEDYPKDWATAQIAIGLANLLLGELEVGTQSLNEALEHFQLALDVYTRERRPTTWANLKINIGAALITLAERELLQSPTAGMISGILRTDQVIQPVDQQFQTLPAKELQAAIKREEARSAGIIHLEEAIRSFEDALPVLASEQTPLPGAQTRCSLSMALLRLGEQEEGTYNLEKSLDEVKLALSVFDKNSREWVDAEEIRGRILFRIGERKSGICAITYLERAVAALRGVLCLVPEVHNMRFAGAHLNLGAALNILARYVPDSKIAEEGLSHSRTAADLYRRIGAEKHQEWSDNNTQQAQTLLEEMKETP